MKTTAMHITIALFRHTGYDHDPNKTESVINVRLNDIHVCTEEELLKIEKTFQEQLTRIRAYSKALPQDKTLGETHN